MTQAWNLSQLANKVNTSGQLDISTGVSGTLPIANGGTNNGALPVTAGGIIYTDGSKQVNTGAGTSGQVLTSGGAGAPTWTALSAGGALNNIQYFTTAGTSTYTPTAGTNFVIVEVVGGGGGGSYGAGGSGGAAGAGGTSSFGSIVSCTGGGGGGSDTGGSAGAATGGDLNISGSVGVGLSVVNGGRCSSVGASTNYGTFGQGGWGGAKYTVGNGSGGSGGSGSYARKKITSSFSGVTITVGAGGTASSGGAGGQGIVIVYEYK